MAYTCKEEATHCELFAGVVSDLQMPCVTSRPFD